MLLSRFIKQHKRANACKCGNAVICFDDVDVCFFGLLFQSAQDNILDIASQDTRLSLCRELQNLGNAIAERVPHDIRPATVTFDLLGHIEAQAYVTIEHDPILDAWMGSMVMNLPSDTLTESSLRNLPSDWRGLRQRPRSRHDSVRQSPRSERSQSTSSSQSRSLRSNQSQSATRSHTICDMYQLGTVRFTKSRL